MARRSIKQYKVKSIAEFAKRAEDQLVMSAGNWYRGISNAAHSLLPGLFRHPTKNTLEELIQLEARMLEDFERHAILHVGDMSATGSEADFKKLFFMQHYGIPTRLLDWTTNPFIALYFALSTAQYGVGTAPPANDAVVWILNPVEWNRKALAHVSHGDAGAFIHSDDVAIAGYGPRRLTSGSFEPTALRTLNEKAACMLGVTNSPRMFSQRGVFTVFGRDLRSMEVQWLEGGFHSNSLIKIVIPADRIAPLLESLLKIGYTDSVSYPDLHGLAMEIKRSRGFKV